MRPKEQFEVNIRSIGLLASIAGVIGIIDWLANHGGQQLMEGSTLLVIGLSIMADPSKISNAAFKAKEPRNDDA